MSDSEAVYLKKLEQVMNSPTGAVVALNAARSHSSRSVAPSWVSATGASTARRTPPLRRTAGSGGGGDDAMPTGRYRQRKRLPRWGQMAPITIGGQSMTVTEAIRSMLADGVPARGIDYTVGKALERASA